MYFGLSEEQEFFQDNVKKFLADNASIEEIRKITKNGFEIWLIPHTLKLTNLSNIKKNSIVNIEFDILSKYIKNYLL